MKHNYQRNIIALCFALLLASCKVGPDYHKPESPLPSAWLSSSTPQKAIIDQTWWKRFNDPVLDQLIAKASSGNFDLKIATARIAEARAMRASARADLTPMINTKGSAVREGNQIPFPATPGIPFDLTKPFDIYQAGFDASWELDLFGGKRRGVESANAELKSVEASRDDLLVSAIAEVARTYVDIREAQAQLAIAADTIKSDQDTLRIARERFNSGSAPELDVTQAQAHLTQTQSQTPYYQSLLAQAESSMDVLVGDKPGTTQAIVATSMPIPVGNKELLLAAPAQVIADRPDIRVAERKLASATAQQGVATAQLFPDISLSGFFGLLSTDSSTLFTAASKSWSIGGSVVWPILNYSRISASIDAANARQQQAFLEYQKSIVVALSDVERSVTAYSKEEEHRALLKKTVNDNHHALDIARMRYKEGLTSYLEVLDAERTMYASEIVVTEAEAKASQNLIAVYKSLGGGWKDTAPAEKTPAPVNPKPSSPPAK